MTEREIYVSMIEGSFDPATLKAFAEKKIAQLDHRNEKAKERAAAKRAAGDELQDLVFSFVGDEAKTRTQIADEMIAAGHDVTPGKVGARLTKLVDSGKIAKAKARVAGEDGKNKTIMVYALGFEAEEE